MSHSKRNTSLAFFTAHERSQVRAHWGSQSTRLTRDSFLPFGYCRLCLGVARDPVTCGGVSVSSTSNASNSAESSSSSTPKVHIFCRECALNDLVSQRREIKRVEKSAGERGREEATRKADEAEEKRRRDVERFERANLSGFALVDADGGGHGNGSGSGGLKKRKREARELHSSSSVGSSTNGTDSSAKRTTAAIDENDNIDNHKEKKNKNKSSETSFWIPSTSTTAATAADGNHAIAKPPPKQHPICPASTPSTPHTYSLKTLIAVHFTEEGQGKDDDNPPSASTTKTTSRTRICPSCKKALTNTSRAMLGATATGDKCGHVVCGNCVDLFRSVPPSGSGSGLGSAKPAPDIRCYVCEADLNGGGVGASNEIETEGEKISNGHDNGKVKNNGKSKSSQQHGGRLLEISCEGTGFAGGGANMAKREGVSFQC